MNTQTNNLPHRFSLRATARGLALAAVLISSLALTGCDKLDDWTNRDPAEYDNERVGSFVDFHAGDLRSA